MAAARIARRRARHPGHSRSGTDCEAWDATCPNTTFHASRDSAQAYLAARGGIEGEILSQRAAVTLAERIFGPLLGGVA